jgi:hypothetical protein
MAGAGGKEEGMKVWRSGLGAWLVVLALAGGAVAGEDQERLSLTGFPRETWSRTFSAEVKEAAIAVHTGEVVACTESMVYYFRDRAQPAWTAGEGQDWKHVADLGIGWDGRRVLFQTDRKPRLSTEGMTLTVHFFDGEGKESWQKPNPYRYESCLLSPSGRYLAFGEEMAPGLKLYDENLNPLWQKPIKFWHLRFDPTEKYLFDGEGGILYTLEGAQVWDAGPYARVLSVSDEANYLMTQYFRTVSSGQSIFLLGRREFKKIELRGAGGCVSPDGLLSAYVTIAGRLEVYKTAELLAAGAQAKPLFTAAFKKPWMMQIGRDNRTLLTLGAESDNRSVLMLADLVAMKIGWKKTVDPAVRLARPTENNDQVAVRTDPRTLLKYRCY